MSAIAIILARGGSKRIPRKNVRPFLGEPVIWRPIRAALESGRFDEVMVSTDDEEIAAVAREGGAVTPFRRTDANASDNATTTNALLEVLQQYRESGREFDYLCGIYACTPLIEAAHLVEGWDLMQTHPEAETVMPVVQYGYPIQRAFHVSGRELKMVMPENAFARSQDLAPSYHDAGQWYWLRRDRFEAERKIFTDHCMPVVLSELATQDIDNEVDWRLAELKANLRMSQL